MQKQSSPPTKKGSWFELALIGPKKSRQSAEMIVMSVAEHKGVDCCGVELENRDVVVDRLRRVAEIYQNVALFAPAP